MDDPYGCLRRLLRGMELIDFDFYKNLPSRMVENKLTLIIMEKSLMNCQGLIIVLHARSPS